MAFRAACCSVWSLLHCCSAAVPAVMHPCLQPQTVRGDGVGSSFWAITWQEVTWLKSSVITVPCSIARDSAANNFEDDLHEAVFKMSRDAFAHSSS